MGVNFLQLNTKNYSSIAGKIGCSEVVCRGKLFKILRDGLSNEEKDGLINNGSKSEPSSNAKILAEYTLHQLCNIEDMMKSFSKNLHNNRIAISITQLPPNKLASFNKDAYLETKEANLDDNDLKYIVKHHGENAFFQTIL